MPQMERLSKYQIVEVIGRGAMGVVYKAFDPHIRRTVAIKTIRKELIENERAEAMLARFRNEAQAAGRLSHPGIVAVFEYGEEAALSYIVMEYIEGNSLREYFNRDVRFGDRDTVSIMAQLLDALAYAHAQGVWHRDIKPANLMIMTSGKLRIADFGIARIDSSNLTQIGSVMGTPGYMAPEQYSGAEVDWRADLFSAGVVLYQLLTGVKPFAGTAESVAYRICHEDARPPSRLESPARVSPAYDRVVARAMARSAAERFQSAQEFRSALLDAHAAPVSSTVSEDTILTGLIATAVSSEPPGAAGSSGLSAPTPTPARTTEPPPGWDAALLKQIDAHLTRVAGPVAKVLVRRAARQTVDLDDLYARLAATLGPEEQKAFMATRSALSHARTRAATLPGVAPLTAEGIDAAQHRLAAQIGPIAKVLVKKAAAQASSMQQFHLLLADSLGSEAERTRFLREMGLL